jgi:HD-GYP domain-containing protein (c-di-GMP phosphodiesterase class II)/DNA-binding CsgD family transcriptional regulator
VGQTEEPSALRLAELLGVLSLGADLGMGQPMEHMLRQCLIALNLAERIGLDQDAQEAVYFGSLVVWVGCHVDDYEQAKWFGDESVLKGDFRLTDFRSSLSAPLFMMRHLGGSRTLRERMGVVPSFLGEGRRVAESMLDNHWRASEDLMAQVGLGQLVRDTVEQTFERWDGRGVPKGLKGDEILFPSRLVNLADVVEVFYRSGGVDAAIAVARERAGTQFDPALVDAFVSAAPALFADIDAVPAWESVIGSSLGSRCWLTGRELDAALEAVADFADVKSPYRIGHSRGVATLVSAAARAYGLTDDEARLARRAALMHDLGQLGVSNTIWDKPGSLNPVELERVRLHPYLTERMLASSPGLAPLAAVAVLHHERLDGSGYPRGLSGQDITPAGRLLAAADSYHARMEPRPHRPELAPEQAAAELRAEVRAARLDADAVTAVLGAAGHSSGKRRTWPAGLTAREVDILRLLARGLSNKQIAGRLTISAKTAGTHVEHIYTKLGVSNRAMAGLFAARHGLITAGEEEPSTSQEQARAR